MAKRGISMQAPDADPKIYAQAAVGKYEGLKVQPDPRRPGVVPAPALAQAALKRSAPQPNV